MVVALLEEALLFVLGLYCIVYIGTRLTAVTSHIRDGRHE